MTMKPFEPTIVMTRPSWLILWKPPGWVVQGDSGDRSLRRWLGIPRIHTVHRLDAPVSGLLVVALTPIAASRLGRSFQERRIRKDYLALLHGKDLGLPSRLRSTIRFGHGRAYTTTTDDPKGRRAVTICRVLMRDPAANLLLTALRPLTGRRHQLRLHMAAAGHPIVGDRRYGAPDDEGFPPHSIGLHAWRLTLTCPDHQDILTVTAPLPPWWPSWSAKSASNQIGKPNGP